VGPLRCPTPKCKTHLSLTDVQYILLDTPENFHRYAARAAMTRLEGEARNKNSSTRRCPAERCNFIFVFEKGSGAEGRLFQCPECHASFCLQCGANQHKVGPAHPGKSCAERLEQLQVEAEERRKFEQWEKENSQADSRFNEMLAKEKKTGKTHPCPNCGVPITKNGGCPHMHCTACRTSFNWKGKG